MKIPYFQINAFTGKHFQGNPAGVCLLQNETDDRLMQQIARENNLSETAFVLPSGTQFSIRWFTPVTEVDLCGHATLASSHAIMEFTEFSGEPVRFMSKRGLLEVRRDGELYKMNFPCDSLEKTTLPGMVKNAFSGVPEEIYRGKSDYLLVYPSETDIIQADPDMNLLAGGDGRGVIITAPGKNVDFVSRFFAPQSGIPEDPVTGSAHTTLTPYWSQRLNKEKLTANQLSERGGELYCTFLGDRVEIAGRTELYIAGYIYC
jgi:PhzF family phenazine biosynthesis protein